VGISSLGQYQPKESAADLIERILDDSGIEAAAVKLGDLESDTGERYSFDETELEVQVAI
jgi:hypothetical protein